MESILHSLQDHLLGLFQPAGATPDLNRFTASLVLGHVDTATSLLADSVDLAAALANDKAVGFGVRQDQVARGGLLGCGGESLLDDGAGLGHVLRGSAENPGEGA